MPAVEQDRANVVELRGAHEARLRVLRLRAAREGASTPPEVLTEIDDIREKLSALAETLETVAQSPIQSDIADAIGPVARYQLTMSHIMRLDGDISDVRKDVTAVRDELSECRDKLSQLTVFIGAIGGALALLLFIMILVRVF